MKKRNKQGLLKLNSDHDFLKAFQSEPPDHPAQGPSEHTEDTPSHACDKHGLQVLGTQIHEEDFETLLEQSFINESNLPCTVKPVPVKKRLKRYPPVETELDLHGCTADQARIKALSFLQNKKRQGYFTLRIIVGKGKHSQMGPVLPDIVEDLAVALKKEGLILSFEWDRKLKSKSGAMIVYLKQFDQFD
ncbi:MAG: Smr/MutS family protein [Pseudomonadota bacterium]